MCIRDRSSANPGKHYDHTVDRGSPQRNHNLEGTNLYAGNNGSDNIALIIPSLTGFAGSDGNVSEFPTGTDLLIESAMWNVYCLLYTSYKHMALRINAPREKEVAYG